MMGSALGTIWLLPAGSVHLLSGKDQQWPALARVEEEMFVMRLFVVGADGHLGTDMGRLLAPVSAVTALTFHDLDITDRPSFTQAIESGYPDVVVDCAAWTAVDRAETEEDAAYRVNVLGARNVAQAAQRVSAGVVHFSTDYVIDGTAIVDSCSGRYYWANAGQGSRHVFAATLMR